MKIKFMDTKELLNKLKLTFAELVQSAEPKKEEPTKMSDPVKAKLADGTEVEISSFEVGGIVTIAGQPAPAGDHKLEDGTMITVGENGAITAIVPPVMVEDMSAKFSALEQSTNEKFKAYESKFAEYESKLNRATQVIEALTELTQRLADTPTGTPDPVVTGFKKVEMPKEPTTSKGINFDLLFS